MTKLEPIRQSRGIRIYTTTYTSCKSVSVVNRTERVMHTPSRVHQIKWVYFQMTMLEPIRQSISIRIYTTTYVLQIGLRRQQNGEGYAHAITCTPFNGYTFRWRCWSQYGSPSIFEYTRLFTSCKSVSVLNRTERATNARPCTTPSTTCTEINYNIQGLHHVREECTTNSTTCAEIDYYIQRLHRVPRLHLPTDYMTHIN